MNICTLYLALIISFCLTWSCSSHEVINPVVHQIKFITGSTNNKLEVIDWGGNGRPLIFLAGLGNTAHVFDEFAPKFTYSFHVYALTRRGFGASSPSSSYNMKTLASDILIVIDSLHLDKVILVGHSLAGDEITKFAGLYPSRIDRIIYLDAAYDRTKIDQFLSDFPAFPKATAKDSSSFINLKKFLKTLVGVNVPDDDLWQTTVFSKEGLYLKEVTADSIIGMLVSSIEVPDYKNIKSPALAIYATNESISHAIPFYETLDSVNKRKADKIYPLLNKFSDEEQTRFKKEVKNGVVKIIRGANHYLFISHPIETEKMMREFLN